MIAARVAAELRDQGDADVRVVRGRLGELSVLVDGQVAYDAPALSYPRPHQILTAVRSFLSSRHEAAIEV